ncbi:hypothetical protein H0274_07940 [Altererythrobacter sp. CC-YST694]|uniref:hypothetical protein n=1 Tax=Altererythrobacter sp. CC-YST694 TaxID=2755038 RepID=UPI001D0104FA|nr:hypothetical protein [Altererythrobacter sp. CC-YST694]MCB5425184.1 hypothetical protein [Altererythrobacter sp. CC-YST694]
MDRTFLFPVELKTKLHLSWQALALTGAILSAALASPAMAASGPTTKVVGCGDQSCLLVSGHRDDPTLLVSINGQVVDVEGGQNWRVRVPVETVRQLSAPNARTIEVGLLTSKAQMASSASVDLPIGLLGNLTNLAALEVRVR